MRWIVTGSQGQLGRCMGRVLDGYPQEDLVGHFSHSELDLSRQESVYSALQEESVATADFLVNCAAFTDVDGCETNEEAARAANADGPAWLAMWCREQGIRLIHISTDYVFAGDAGRPYKESDPVDPRTAYGRTKEEGERRVLASDPEALVVRTSWVFGPGQNFVEAIVRQAELRKQGEASGPLRVVSDQWGSPTYASDLAEGIVDLVLGQEARTSAEFVGLDSASRGVNPGPPSGILHLSNAGETSWFEFAREILDLSGHAEIEVLPVSSEEFKRPAPRPAWSVLDCGRAESLGVRLRAWPEALRDYLDLRMAGEFDGVNS
ncbi:MAG: dTDP-4-dehydrorhamnose reductase [Myxococcota bacterium]|nr:dTDP-4-dehydrorhamnose reductase [Myxococcota bacterium]